MREWHVAKEVMIWHRFAFAFVTYHRRRKLGLRADAEEGRLVGSFCGLADLDRLIPDKEEVQFIRECYLSPDGWEEEKTRILAVQNAPNPQWTPPSHIEWKL